jgi:S-adenosylmethionine decarboxylase
MSSGKHMICDIKNIKNSELLNSPVKLLELLDNICKDYQYNVIQKSHHIFEPQGFTAIYLLSESHISIHTFPERNYIALDIYTCREYLDNVSYLNIYKHLIEIFDAEKLEPLIIDRNF